MGTLGIITEQGDLGLGYQEITDEEKKVIKENDELQLQQNPSMKDKINR